MRQGAVAVSIPADDVYRWRVLGVVMLGTFMSALDSSIVNVSLPNMMASFGASVDDIEWVVTGYMLGFSTFMPLTAWLRDRVGYRVLYIASLAVFIAGSALCGIAPNLPALVLARVIQAFGGGAITPTGLAMIAEVFPPKERGRALGLWGVGVVVGPAFGPTLGGYLTETLGWRSIFNINLPIGIVGLLAASRILRVDKPHAQTSRGFDLPGFVLLTTFLVAALLGLSNGNREGWSSSYVVTCALVTSVSFVLFLAVESIVSARILDLGLFRSPQFTVAMVVTAARSVALYGGIFLLPLFLQDLMGRSEIDTGALAASRRAGHGDGHAGFRPDCGAIRHAHTDDCWPYTHCLVHVDVPQTGRDHKHMGRALSNPDTRVGLGLLVTPVMTAAINAVPTTKAGMASSMLSLIQQISGSLGIAILACVLGRRTTFHLAVVGQGLAAARPALADATRSLVLRAVELGSPPSVARLLAGSLVARKIAEAASVLAFNDAFLVGAGIVGAGAIPALFLASKSKASARGVPAPAELAD